MKTILHYKECLEFRIENPQARTKKLFVFQETQDTQLRIARDLLGKVTNFLSGVDVVLEREGVSIIEELPEGASKYLKQEEERLLTLLTPAFSLSPTGGLCQNTSQYFLYSGWQGGRARAKTLVRSCFTLMENEEVEETYLPSLLTKTKSGKVLCPTCGATPH